MTTLSAPIARSFEQRGISAETAAKMGCYSGRWDADEQKIVSDPKGTVVVFPFIDGGEIVAEKYRAPGKKFWQRAGGRKTFWNADVLDDPSLHDGRHALLVTEGEIDALTAIDAGYPFTVSVPEGAVPPSEASNASKGPVNDETGKFSFLWNNRERLKKVKRFIIAMDNDPAGIRMADELVRRLSASRCFFIEYPEGCKDLNDVRKQHGAERVREVINSARPFPVKGLYRLNEYPEGTGIETYSTGWATLDNHFLLFAPALVVVTGIPGHGKSTWLNNLLINAAENHHWRSVIFSPELPVVPFLRDKMRACAGRASVERLQREGRLGNIDRWLEEYFFFIDYDQEGDEEITLEYLIERIEDAVFRHGIRIAVIDPWNEVEHARRRDENQDEYTNRATRTLKRLAKRLGIMIFVLAHPTKDVQQHGKSRKPTLYDIHGCYSDDTEVLTQRGWLHHAQITMSDDVACYNPALSSVEYHQPTRIIRKEITDGEMLHFSGAGYDLLVTPEHRMLVKPKWKEPVGSKRGRPVRFEKGRWHLVEADSLPSANFAIPLAGEAIAFGADPDFVQIGGVNYPADAFWRLVGWYIAEGGYGPTGINWTQAVGELADRFTETFAEAGIPASLSWATPRPQDRGTLTCGRWYIGRRYSKALIDWFKTHCGSGSENKRVPSSVFDLSPRIKRIVLDAYLEGDGSRSFKSRNCVTTSRQLRDDLQRLAVELGTATNSSEREPTQDNHRRQFTVTFGGAHRSEVTMRTQRNLRRVKYSGNVWCLDVPTGAYFVRRNGRVTACGNSSAWFNKPDIGIVVDRPDYGNRQTEIYIDKVRFEGTGSHGKVVLQFDPSNCRYMLLNQQPSDMQEILV